MSGVVEDLRPVKVERETRWWWESARAKRAWDRVDQRWRGSQGLTLTQRNSKTVRERENYWGPYDGVIEVWFCCRSFLQGKVEISDAPLAKVEVVWWLVESQISAEYFGLFGICRLCYFFFLAIHKFLGLNVKVNMNCYYKIFRVFASIYTKISISLKIKADFLYFTYSLFITLHILLTILHYIAWKYYFLTRFF